MDNTHVNITLDDFLTVPYVDGGRTMSGADCWGAVRLMLHHIYNVPWLKSFGHISPDDKQSMTDAAKEVEQLCLPISKPRDGCIVACFRRGVMLHVGVVVEQNGLQVYHTGRKHGPLKTTLRNFEKLFFTVKYYAYSPGVPEQT